MLNDNVIVDSTELGNNSSESHYKSLFIELSAIGSGGFGTVFKVKHKIDDQIYAVKKVTFKVSSEYVVQYYNSWPETEYLYIQMEFCSQNLRNILEKKAKVFSRELGDPMDCVDLELHLNVENSIYILIAENVRNGRFVKLCDFGLAVEHQKASQSHTTNVGTIKYMAPELDQSKYTTKSDIYCLGILSMELFDIFLENTHTAAITYRCECDVSYINNLRLSIQIRVTHKGRAPRKVRCQWLDCDFQTPHSSRLDNHANKVHQN
ncbi:unnamed protein product [Oppiella nova]|uniref:Protein kinase domain-containing protein n=1 Tax=Oppiella nova TaxID=334625 RepID=A0A7R9QR95_9ACAR|nr:unnamed protein product [Oppiella nova]CAG2170976.1 unnamed protein product [Oppiella nova]